MARRQEPEEHGESAPLWIISFADLVTLMLSFFVILAGSSSSDVTLDPAFAEIVASLKAAFRNVQPTDTKAGSDPKAEFAELVQRLMGLDPNRKSGRRGDADGKGVYGRHLRVTRLRDGLEVAMGGPVFFEPFSVKPTAEGEQQLAQIAKIVKGHRNVVEIRGHVGETPWPSDWNYDNVMRLGYDRANHVAQALIAGGLDPRAVRLVAVGPNEPLKANRTEPATTSENRRVEIIVRESMIDDYVTEVSANREMPPSPEVPATQPAVSRPAA